MPLGDLARESTDRAEPLKAAKCGRMDRNLAATKRCRVVRTTLTGLLLLLFFGTCVVADDEHLGAIEYEIACMTCHGIDGKGNGPQAPVLTAAPSDLTRIAISNGGKFPIERVMAIIDGRKHVAAHGQRTMPVWGDRYRVYVEPGESRTSVDRRARNRINALARYVERLQAK